MNSITTRLTNTVLDSGEYTFVVKRSIYQADESTGQYSLAGCLVAPGFDFCDFSFITNEELIHKLKAYSVKYTYFI